MAAGILDEMEGKRGIRAWRWYVDFSRRCPTNMVQAILHRGIHHDLHRPDEHVATPRLPTQHTLDVPRKNSGSPKPGLQKTPAKQIRITKRTVHCMD